MVLGSSGEDQPRLATDSKLRGSVRTRRDYCVAYFPEQQSVDSFLNKSDKRNEVLYVYYIVLLIVVAMLNRIVLCVV